MTKCPSCNIDSKSTTIQTFKPNQNMQKRNLNQIHEGEPCMVNPCLQEAVYDVMSHSQKLCSIGSEEERKLTTLIANGEPYVLASDVQ